MWVGAYSLVVAPCDLKGIKSDRAVFVRCYARIVRRRTASHPSGVRRNSSRGLLMGCSMDSCASGDTKMKVWTITPLATFSSEVLIDE
jgi:hypothetical protein